MGQKTPRRESGRGNGAFDSLEDRDCMLQSGMEAGAVESMQRLDELLAELQQK